MSTQSSNFSKGQAGAKEKADGIAKNSATERVCLGTTEVLRRGTGERWTG